MRKIINHLKQFIKSDFNIYSYLWAIIFISSAITINYIFKFERKILNPTQTSGLAMVWFPLYYMFAWFSVLIPKLLIEKKYQILKNRNLYIKSIIILILIGIASGFSVYKFFKFDISDSATLLYILKGLTQLKCLAIYLIPLFILKHIYDRQTEGVYGFRKKFDNGFVYLKMLLIVVPLIIIASFTSDFIQAYPRFKPWQFENFDVIPLWISTIIFEILYMIDFVMVEWIFRGALVIGMIAIMGKESILPMVSVYVFLHFGKPLGETISSFFGGYILGVLAYYTRHIWGGVILHIGVALTMEIMGFFQFYILAIRK